MVNARRLAGLADGQEKARYDIEGCEILRLPVDGAPP
jgi:hypothetical protein